MRRASCGLRRRRAGLLLAPVVFGLGMYFALVPLVHTDGVFEADGRPHHLSLLAHERRAIFVDAGAMLGGIALAFIGPMLLGLAGLLVLIVTGILFETRPPRARS